MSREIYKLKEWLQFKPQFQITSQDGSKINTVIRIKDGVEFYFGEFVGDIKIAGFCEDCIHLYAFITTKTSAIETITFNTKVRKLEINELEFIEEKTTEYITFNIN